MQLTKLSAQSEEHEEGMSSRWRRQQNLIKFNLKRMQTHTELSNIADARVQPALDLSGTNFSRSHEVVRKVYRLPKAGGSESRAWKMLQVIPTLLPPATAVKIKRRGD